MVTRFFKVESRGSTPLREFQAGLTTFAAMAYILAVNPSILAPRSIPVFARIDGLTARM